MCLSNSVISQLKTFQSLLSILVPLLGGAILVQNKDCQEGGPLLTAGGNGAFPDEQPPVFYWWTYKHQQLLSLQIEEEPNCACFWMIHCSKCLKGWISRCLSLESLSIHEKINQSYTLLFAIWNLRILSPKKGHGRELTIWDLLQDGIMLFIHWTSSMDKILDKESNS